MSRLSISHAELGYGKCEGYATRASGSSDAALRVLADRLGLSEDDLEDRLCTIGHSLGAAVALDFAAHHPVQRVVVISPFTTLRDEAATVAGGWRARLLIESYDNLETCRLCCNATRRRASPFSTG